MLEEVDELSNDKRRDRGSRIKDCKIPSNWQKGMTKKKHNH